MKILNAYKPIIKDILFTLKDFPQNIFLDKKICIDRSNHPFWKTYHTNPPIKYTSKLIAEVGHYFNFTPKDHKKNFILDSEHILHFSGVSRNYEYMVSQTKVIEERLSADNCLAIIFPTHGAIQEARKYASNQKIFDKINVIRPAYPVRPLKEYNDNKPFNILTIGNKFWGKGTHLSLEIFKILREKLGADIEYTLVCGDIPAGHPIPEGVTIIDVPNITDQLRDQLYNNADIFLFPCLQDSFGVYQEALAYGVPMLSTNIYDKAEIVIDGQTGYLIDTPLSMYAGNFGTDWKSWDDFQDQIQKFSKDGGFVGMIEVFVDKIKMLYDDRKLLKQLSVASQKLNETDFTIERKNRELVDLYNRVYPK